MRKSERRITTTVGVVAVILFGVVPLTLGSLSIDRYASGHPSTFVPTGWIRTTGVIVGEHGGFSVLNRRGYYRPTVAFTDDTGSSVRFTANDNYYFMSDLPKAGTKVKVAYDPADPGKAEYVGEPGSGRSSTLVVGIFEVLVGLVFGAALTKGLIIDPAKKGSR